MINCKNCGIGLDEHMNFCPVCGVTVVINENREKLVREREQSTVKLKNEISQLNVREKRKFFLEVISIILFAAIASTLVLNFVISNSFTWSLYVLVGSCTVFFFATIFAFYQNIYVLFLASIVTTFLSIFFLDLVNNTIDWSYQLGLPLLIVSSIIVLILLLLYLKVKEKGFNLVAYTFLAIGLLTLAVQWIVSLYIDQPRMDWSLIVFFSVLPVVIVLLYFHYKLRKGTDLRKFFHI